MEIDTALELKEVLGHYEIGELCDYEQLYLGYCNTSYIIWTVIGGAKQTYFLRKYKKRTGEEEIEFEHSVINHLIENDFDLVADVIGTRDAKTYVKRFEEGDDGQEVVFYAIFEFLPGEDKYTWVDPACNDEVLRGAATVLAQFHSAVFDLKPQGKRYEPKIVELLPVVARNVETCLERTKDTVFDAYFLDNLALILKNIEHTRRALDEQGCQGIVQQVIHCDFHPGNLKFQNDSITGLFDFDWSKVDARCFDVALALTYFCARWPAEASGCLELDKVAVFWGAYQDALKEADEVQPLSDLELTCLPPMIKASNLFVLNWTVQDFYSQAADPKEYLIYLRHGVHLIRWLESKDNWTKLKSVIGSARLG